MLVHSTGTHVCMPSTRSQSQHHHSQWQLQYFKHDDTACLVYTMCSSLACLSFVTMVLRPSSLAMLQILHMPWPTLGVQVTQYYSLSVTNNAVGCCGCTDIVAQLVHACKVQSIGIKFLSVTSNMTHCLFTYQQLTRKVIHLSNSISGSAQSVFSERPGTTKSAHMQMYISYLSTYI